MHQNNEPQTKLSGRAGVNSGCSHSVGDGISGNVAGKDKSRGVGINAIKFNLVSR